jgi:hypothetical protein
MKKNLDDEGGHNFDDDTGGMSWGQEAAGH